jgi:hypothetical protein
MPNNRRNGKYFVNILPFFNKDLKVNTLNWINAVGKTRALVQAEWNQELCFHGFVLGDSSRWVCFFSKKFGSSTLTQFSFAILHQVSWILEPHKASTTVTLLFFCCSADTESKPDVFQIFRFLHSFSNQYHLTGWLSLHCSWFNSNSSFTVQIVLYRHNLVFRRSHRLDSHLQIWNDSFQVVICLNGVTSNA